MEGQVKVFVCVFLVWTFGSRACKPETLLSVGEKFLVDILRTYWWKSTILQFVAEWDQVFLFSSFRLILEKNSNPQFFMRLTVGMVWLYWNGFRFLNSSVQAVTIFVWVSSSSWKRAGKLPEIILVKITVCGTLIRLLEHLPSRSWCACGRSTIKSSRSLFRPTRPWSLTRELSLLSLLQLVRRVRVARLLFATMDRFEVSCVQLFGWCFGSRTSFLTMKSTFPRGWTAFISQSQVRHGQK